MATNLIRRRVAQHRDAIRRSYMSGATTSELARMYECHSTTIYALVADLTSEFPKGANVTKVERRASANRAAIRRDYASGVSPLVIARRFSISTQTVYRYCRDLVHVSSVSVKDDESAVLKAREKAAFRRFDELGDKVSYDRWQEAKKARIPANAPTVKAPRPSRFY